MFSGKNLLPLILTALLFVTAIIASICATAYSRGANELRALQAKAAAIDYNRNLVRSLANDAVEYSKHNPAINPILQSVGINPAPVSPKTTK